MALTVLDVVVHYLLVGLPVEPMAEVPLEAEVASLHISELKGLTVM